MFVYIILQQEIFPHPSMLVPFYSCWRRKKKRLLNVAIDYLILSQTTLAQLRDSSLLIPQEGHRREIG